MRTLTITLYFVIAIIILASLGVSLPYFFDKANNDPNLLKNLNQNLVTYFIAILVSASLDYVLTLVDSTNTYRKPAILIICLVNLVMLAITIFILFQNSKGTIKTLSGWAIFGVAIAYVMWWFANINNSAFNVSTAPLGGDVDRTLNNG